MSAYNAVHLNTLQDDNLTLYYSAYHQRRARQVHSFLAELHNASNRALNQNKKLELLVLDKGDWLKLSSSVYGIAHFRKKKATVELLVAADYPARLLHQLDSVFLAASFRMPSEITELLNLLLGFEWAAVYLKQLNYLASSSEESLVKIAKLYLLALETAGWSLQERLAAWFLKKEAVMLFEDELDARQLKLALQSPKSQKSLKQKYLAYSWAFSESSSSSRSWGDFSNF